MASRSSSRHQRSTLMKSLRRQRTTPGRGARALNEWAEERADTSAAERRSRLTTPHANGLGGSASPTPSPDSDSVRGDRQYDPAGTLDKRLAASASRRLEHSHGTSQVTPFDASWRVAAATANLDRTLRARAEARRTASHLALFGAAAAVATALLFVHPGMHAAEMVLTTTCVVCFALSTVRSYAAATLGAPKSSVSCGVELGSLRSDFRDMAHLNEYWKGLPLEKHLQDVNEQVYRNALYATRQLKAIRAGYFWAFICVPVVLALAVLSRFGWPSSSLTTGTADTAGLRL